MSHKLLIIPKFFRNESLKNLKKKRGKKQFQSIIHPKCSKLISLLQSNFLFKPVRHHRHHHPFTPRPRARSSRTLCSRNDGLIYREAEQAVTYGN